ncbi:MAG: hypothetical protein E7129_03840 [Rikenellaceae bacterium]|nr:hypothetical protein [Rikenellaceae bacterium]
MRKLILSLILSLCAFFAYAEGISNYKELLAFAKAVNKEADVSAWQNEKGVVCLKADIDMKKGKKFPTMKVFNGKFDGCGHKLYNWSAKSSLFGTLETKAVVQNIVIDASCHLEVKTAYNEAHEYVSYIAQINRGRILNCVNHGSIEHIGDEANKEIMIGAMAGCNLNIVYNCLNTGTITCRTNFSNTAGGKGIRLGGLVGTCYGKNVVGGSTISRCVNTGNISYMGDFPNNNIGGIVGESSRTTVKYCVNKGNVVAIGMPYSAKKPVSRASGITSWANADIICCDNFGVVSVSGAHESIAAGICARINNTLTIVDCVNYGKVSTNASNTAMVGGIFGHTVHMAHINQCRNYGAVLNEGATNPAWAGGIAGTMSLRKGSKVGSFLRDCVNYAGVVNKSAHKKSATGGVVASCSGHVANEEEVLITIANCANFGKISGLGKNSRSEIGWSKYVKKYGKFYDDFAKVVKPLQDGTNVFGRVVDTTGMPVADVVVSDGVQSVKTDVNGEYTMKSKIADTRFVTISIPADYEIPLRDNRPQFFRRVPRYAEAVRADFVLKKRENFTDEFTLVMIGDPQTRGSKTDQALERFRDVVLPDIAALNHKTKEEVYAIALGNLVYNSMTSYDDYVEVLANAAVPMVSVIGNHDYDQRTLFETKFGTPYFESYIAPVNYSFNIGKMHFVVVNNILYNRPTDRHKYKTGLENYTYKWLESDLAHVDESTTIVLCSHAPLFKTRSNYNEKSVNYKKYAALLSKYNKVYAWAGHTRQNHSFDYAVAPAKYEALKNVEVITVARCSGMIRLNRELNNDGTPNGYMVADVKGDKMQWYYKSVDHGRDYQMRVYSPTRTKSEYVKAIVWNHSPETWSNPEWWENGVKVADMELSKENDLDYLNIYAEHNQQKLGKTERKYSKPVKSPFFFRVKPSEGVSSGEVRVTDQFGVTYTQKIGW